VTVADS